MVSMLPTSSEGVSITFDHELPFIVENADSWENSEDPSRYDWLSTVAGLGAKSWDEFFFICLDGSLQHPMK